MDKEAQDKITHMLEAVEGLLHGDAGVPGSHGPWLEGPLLAQNTMDARARAEESHEWMDWAERFPHMRVVGVTATRHVADAADAHPAMHESLDTVEVGCTVSHHDTCGHASLCVCVCVCVCVCICMGEALPGAFHYYTNAGTQTSVYAHGVADPCRASRRFCARG